MAAAASKDVTDTLTADELAAFRAKLLDSVPTPRLAGQPRPSDAARYYFYFHSVELHDVAATHRRAQQAIVSLGAHVGCKAYNGLLYPPGHASTYSFQGVDDDRARALWRAAVATLDGRHAASTIVCEPLLAPHRDMLITLAAPVFTDNEVLTHMFAALEADEPALAVRPLHVPLHISLANDLPAAATGDAAKRAALDTLGVNTFDAYMAVLPGLRSPPGKWALVLWKRAAYVDTAALRTAGEWSILEMAPL